MTETDVFTPESPALTPPPFSNSLETFDEADQADAAETTARQFLANNAESKVLITKLAVAGNLASEFANPCKREKYCGSYEFSPGEELESLYSFVQENYEGGKYRFQIRAGQRNGRTWQKTLADLPGTKPRVAVSARSGESDDEAPEREQTVIFTPREPEPPAKPENPFKTARETINENLAFYRELKDVFGDIVGAQGAAPAQTTPTREQVLFELAKNSDDKDTKKRCLDAIIGDGESDKPQSKSFGDVAIEVLSNPELLERPVQILAPFVMPYLAPYLGAMLKPQTQPVTGAPPQSFLNPPAARPSAQTPTLPAEQNSPATEGDTNEQTVSRNVTPPRKPRKLQLVEPEETEQTENV